MNTVNPRGLKIPEGVRTILAIVLIGIAVSLIAVAKTVLDTAAYKRTIVQQVVLPPAVLKDKPVGQPGDGDKLGRMKGFVTLTLGSGTDHQASFSAAGLKNWGISTLEDYGWGKHISYISQKSAGSFVAKNGVTVKVDVVSPTSINLISGETKGFLFEDVEGVAVYLGGNTDEDRLVFMISKK